MAEVDVRVVVDVDNVLANPKGPDGLVMEYADREPYPFVRDYMLRLRAEGYRLIVQTARGMNRFKGDQERARIYGMVELKRWLDKWEIPYDEIFFGKSGGICYVDDRAFRVESDKGVGDWDRLIAHLKEMEN
jgi:capsule biosynthesis phosphatase